MKKTKRSLLCLMLAVLMVASCAITAMAAADESTALIGGTLYEYSWSLTRSNTCGTGRMDADNPPAYLTVKVRNYLYSEENNTRGYNEWVSNTGYKTMPVVGYTAIAKQLQSEGHYLAGVPGFYHNKDGSWTLIQEKRGILVPVRDQNGKIQGLQVRRDNIKKGKFRWISSVGKQDGCKAECWTHIVGPPAPTVLLTEGPLKADIINHLTGLTVIAVPGVNSLTHLKEMLEYVQSKGTTRIMTVFDMDYLKNPHVKDGYYNLAAMLAEVGIEYGTYLWDPQYKGLDDYVWHCRQEGTL